MKRAFLYDSSIYCSVTCVEADIREYAEPGDEQNELDSTPVSVPDDAAETAGLICDRCSDELRPVTDMELKFTHRRR